ncbi:MAG: imidazoleglycerol-phosphate dehydratase HisB [Peptococcia bacterium]
MKVRSSLIKRKTKETDIELELKLDGAGLLQGSSGIGFFDHLLELLARHSGFSLDLKAIGDLQVDFHHTVEDIGLCLGQALREALGDKKGLNRYASIILPMDEVLVLCALDLSGRPGYYGEFSFQSSQIGNFATELMEEFFRAFVNEAKITLHLRQLTQGNSHHLAEALIKALARALQDAVCVTGDRIPSSKGVL